MKKQLTEQQLQQLSRQLLEQSVDTLDESVSIGLKKARQHALQSQPKPSFIPQWSGAFAVIMVLFVIVWMGYETPVITDELMLVEDMIQIEETQELINDIEFYQWLEQRGELV